MLKYIVMNFTLGFVKKLQEKTQKWFQTKKTNTPSLRDYFQNYNVYVTTHDKYYPNLELIFRSILLETRSNQFLLNIPWYLKIFYSDFYQNVLFQFNPLQLATGLMLNISDLQNSRQQEVEKNKFIGDILKNNNGATLNYFKYYTITQQINYLYDIISPLRSENPTSHATIEKIKKQIIDLQQEQQNYLLEYKKMKTLYENKSQKPHKLQFVFINNDYNYFIKKHLQTSSILQYYRAEKLFKNLNVFNINFSVNYDRYNKNSSFGFDIRPNMYETMNKNNLILTNEIQKKEEITPLLFENIQEYIEINKDLFEIIKKSCENLKHYRKKFSINDKNSIYIIGRPFKYINKFIEICENIESRQEEIINLIGSDDYFNAQITILVFDDLVDLLDQI